MTEKLLNLDISSKFMQNYQSGKPVSRDEQLKAIKDENGELLLFSIGEDKQLYLLKKASGSETGWVRINMSQELKNTEVTNIAVASDRKGKPILSAVFKFKNNQDANLLYHTQDFSDKATNRWIFRGRKNGVQISSIATGANDKGEVLVVIATDEKDEFSSYLVNPDPDYQRSSDRRIHSWLWKEVPFPASSGTKISHMEIGYLNRLGPILYRLHEIKKGESELIMTSLPDWSVFNRKVSGIGDNPTALTLNQNEQGFSDLYAGGKSVFKLSDHLQLNQDKSKLEKERVMLGNKPLKYNAREIVVGTSSNKLNSAWILSEDGLLYSSRELEPDQWSELIPLQSSIAQLTAYKNSRNDIVDVFVVTLDNELIHLSQDPQNHRWKQREILLEDTEHTVEFSSYTTIISLNDSENYPVVDKSLTIRASELSLVNINGHNFFIDAFTPVSIKPNAAGKITIINKIDQLSTPILRVEAEFLNSAIDIDPSAMIHKRISRLSADELKKAKVKDAKGTERRLVNKDIARNKELMDSTTQALQQLAPLTQSMPNPDQKFDVSNQAKVTTSEHDYAAAFNKNSRLTNKINLASVPDNYRWGLSFKTGQMAFDHNPKTPEVTPSNLFTDVGQFFGDAWESVKNGVTEGVNFIFEKVKDGIQIIIEGVEKAIRVIVETAEQVWSVITWVFEKIKVFIKDLLMWLGFLFEWGDILKTKDVISSMIRVSFNELENQIENGEKYVHNFFENLRKQLSGENSKRMGMSNKSIKSIGAGTDQSSLNSPEIQWASGMVTDGHIAKGKPDSSPALSGFQTQDSGFGQFTEAIEEFVQTVFEGISSLSFSEVLNKALNLLENALLDLMETAVIGLMEAANLAIKTVGKILNVRWNIPILTFLYEKIIAPGSRLSLQEVVCLLAAIPGTILYKIAMGRTPFDSGQVSRAKKATTFSQLKHALIGGKASIKPTVKPFQANRMFQGVTPSMTDPTGRTVLGNVYHDKSSSKKYYDSENDEPIEGARLVLENDNTGNNLGVITTDENGYYQFKNGADGITLNSGNTYKIRLKLNELNENRDDDKFYCLSDNPAEVEIDANEPVRAEFPLENIPNKHLKRTTYAMGYIGGFAAMLYGFINGLQVLEDVASQGNIRWQGFRNFITGSAGKWKMAFGLIAWISSLTAIVISYDCASPDEKDLLEFELGITCMQVIFCIFDFLSVTCNSDKAKSVVSTLITLGGTANIVLFSILNEKEKDAGCEDEVKLAQNLMTSISQFGDVFALFAAKTRNPYAVGTATAALTLVGTPPGIMNMVRTTSDIKDDEIHKNR